MLPRSELADSTAPCIAAAAPLLLNYWLFLTWKNYNPRLAFSTPSGELEAGCGGGTAEAGNAARHSSRPVSRGSYPLQPCACRATQGCAVRLLLALHGWSFSLDSHGEVTEQLQAHKQILLQQAMGRDLCSACQAACMTACRQVAVDRDWLLPSESILQRCSWVMGVCYGGVPAGLLFCPLEEALLDHAALPNSTCKELLGGSQGEKCQFCTMVLFHHSPSSASSVLQPVMLSVRVSPAWNPPSDGNISLNLLPGRCFCGASFPCSPQECGSLSPSGLQQTLKFQAPAALLAEMCLCSPA